MSGPEAAQELIRSVELRFPDASHVAWAYWLPDDQERAWDAGEPRYSAGKPILAQLKGHDRRGLVAVVRWFGGTKLGMGGLVRAYGGAAGELIQQSPAVEVQATVLRELVVPYPDLGPANGLFTRFEAEVEAARWEELAHLTVRLPPEQVEGLDHALSEATRGRVRLRPRSGQS